MRNFVLCIQIRFVSTEKTTRIASRASCFFCNPSVQTTTVFYTVVLYNTVFDELRKTIY